MEKNTINPCISKSKIIEDYYSKGGRLSWYKSKEKYTKFIVKYRVITEVNPKDFTGIPHIIEKGEL